MPSVSLWAFSAEKYFYICKSGKSADFPDLLFHGKSCFLCRERSRGIGLRAFIKIIAAGDAPLGQRQGEVFRVPPPSLWTPPTPQRERGCTPLSDPKAVGLHTKNPSRSAKGFFVLRRFQGPSVAVRQLPAGERAPADAATRHGPFP